MFGLTIKQLSYVAVIGFSAAWAADQLAKEGVLGKQIKKKKTRQLAAPAAGIATGAYAAKLFKQGNP
jgi:hypothetical protein